MTDAFKSGRRTLRPKWSAECRGKGIKTINRRIVRHRLNVLVNLLAELLKG